MTRTTEILRRAKKTAEALATDRPSPSQLQAPFPYFGGKSWVAHEVWQALGNVDHYVEPFFGSGAVLLKRPHPPKLETVNDADGLLANVWRAMKAAPDEVARFADWPKNECDLHARHLWLVNRREALSERLMADPDYYDAKAAGWWIWGACSWIATGWCSGQGPWTSDGERLVDSRQSQIAAKVGIHRHLPHLSDQGVGIHRQIPSRSADRSDFIAAWFAALSNRLREVRVVCGDWTRVVGPSVLRAGGGMKGVFLDPPYSRSERSDCYAVETDVAPAVTAWCREAGQAPDVRIVLAGFEGEHNELEALGWRKISWKSRNGYAYRGAADSRGKENALRERLWLSPSCYYGMLL